MELDLSDPQFYADPYSVYAELRARGPLFRSEHGPWIASGFAEVAALVKDPRVSVGFPGEAGWRSRRGAGSVADAGRWMLLADGAEHRRLRRPAGKALTPRAVGLSQERTAEIVGSVLDALPVKGKVDFAAQVAEPAVAALVTEVLGLPAGHEPRLIRWSSAIIRMADSLSPAPVRAAIDTALAECRGFIEHAHASGSLRPDGLAAGLLASLGREDALANIVLLAIAAIDTTAGQLCTAMLGLLQHPDQLALLRDDPQTAGQSTWEFARFESPVQIITRRLIEEVPTPAGTLHAGQKLMLLLGAANRDPARYREPDRLWLARPDVEPLGFGGGPHYCVGAHLAQAVLGEVLGGLVHRHPHLRSAGPAPTWRHSVVAHRPEYLFLELT